MTFSQVTTTALLAVVLALGGTTLYYRADAAHGRSQAQEALEMADSYMALAEHRRIAHEAATALYDLTRKEMYDKAQRDAQALAAAQRQHEHLRRSLELDRGWADSPIPGGVLDALQGPSDGRNP